MHFTTSLCSFRCLLQTVSHKCCNKRKKNSTQKQLFKHLSHLQMEQGFLFRGTTNGIYLQSRMTLSRSCMTFTSHTGTEAPPGYFNYDTSSGLARTLLTRLPGWVYHLEDELSETAWSTLVSLPSPPELSVHLVYHSKDKQNIIGTSLLAKHDCLLPTLFITGCIYTDNRLRIITVKFSYLKNPG